MATVRRSTKSATSKNSNESNNVIVFVEPPPAGATIPPVPHGFIAAANGTFRGVLPKTAQLSVVGAVVAELKRFTDYVEVFGKTSAPLPTVMQTFDAASQWSAMRKQAAAWDAYCRTQEGNAWQDVRKYADRMQAAFELAASGDATVGARYPALARFFAAGKVSAQKAVLTRKANLKLEAEGKLPFKGGVGKRRKRAAADQALDEKLAAEHTASPPQPAKPATATASPTHGAAAPTVNVGNVGSA